MVSGYEPGWRLEELMDKFSRDYPARREYRTLVESRDRWRWAAWWAWCLCGVFLGLVVGCLVNR